MLQIVTDTIANVLGLGICAAHAWSLRFHFNMPKMPPGVWIITTLVIASEVLLFFLCYWVRQPLAPQVIGIALMCVSAVLFWWTIQETRAAKLRAAFDEYLPHCVLNTGPYAYVRHPFYLSYLLLWSGWGLAAWNIWGVVPLIAMGTTYWLAAREEEANFAKSEHASEYADYVRKTGRFLPKVVRS